MSEAETRQNISKKRSLLRVNEHSKKYFNDVSVSAIIFLEGVDQTNTSLRICFLNTYWHIGIISILESNLG